MCCKQSPLLSQCQSSKCATVPTTPPPPTHTSAPGPPADHLSVPPYQVKVPKQPTPSDRGIPPGVMGPPPSDAGNRDTKQTPSAKAEMCQWPSCYPPSHFGPGGGSLDLYNESLPPPIVQQMCFLPAGGVHRKEPAPPSQPKVPGLLAPGHGYVDMSHDSRYPPHNVSHDRGYSSHHVPHDRGYSPHHVSHDGGYSPHHMSHDGGYQSVPDQAVVAGETSHVAAAMQRDDDDLPPPVYHQPYKRY